VTGFAVIGSGAWGALVAAELARIEGVALVGVADDVPKRAREVAEKLGVKAFASVEAALADGRVTAVAIAAPNDLHAPLALAALDAGKHVLLEKPMALTVAEAEEVDAAARERGLVLLSCGIYGNVVRILVPLSIADEDLARGLDLLEESLGDAGAA
jgi:predicted dehydrogenase